VSRDHVPEYLDSPEAVDAFLATIATARQLALDTEGASFHRFVDRIYLLQLSTRERSAVIDPLPIGTPAGLARLLEDRNVEVVFHDADYDLRLLRQDYGWKVTNVFDTRIAAQLAGIRAFGLAALLEQYFGVKLDKKHQRADWSMRPLTEGMLAYAAQDTVHLLGLRDRLEDELKKLGRLEWAKEEFTRLEDVQWEPEDASMAFLRLKGARDLTRRELALLRELLPWRDALARAVDKSTFRVVSNDVLLEIARLAPASRDALAGIKGMPRGIMERHGDEVLDRVQRGLAVPDAELPRFPRAPRWDRDPDFDARVSRLKSVRDEAAQRLELDPGVLCSRERMEAVARRRPTMMEELLEMKELRRWQVEVLGAGFLTALAQEPAAGAAPAAPAAPPPTGGRGSGRGGAASAASSGASGGSSAAAASAPSTPPSAAASAASGEDESPYRDG
jgi:ribonuclease D